MIPSPMVAPGLKKPEEIAAEIWGITTEQLYQHTRKIEVVEARTVLICYRNKTLKLSHADSAEKYGLKRPSTDSSLKRFAEWLEFDKVFAEKVHEFNAKVL